VAAGIGLLVGGHGFSEKGATHGLL
jgi:hypothetical protein